MYCVMDGSYVTNIAPALLSPASVWSPEQSCVGRFFPAFVILAYDQVFEHCNVNGDLAKGAELFEHAVDTSQMCSSQAPSLLLELNFSMSGSIVTMKIPF